MEGLKPHLFHLVLDSFLFFAAGVPIVGEECPEVQKVDEVDFIDSPTRHCLGFNSKTTISCIERDPHSEINAIFADGKVIEILPLSNQLLLLFFGQFPIVANR